MFLNEWFLRPEPFLSGRKTTSRKVDEDFLSHSYRLVELKEIKRFQHNRDSPKGHRYADSFSEMDIAWT
jgi:hypothetical protein